MEIDKEQPNRAARGESVRERVLDAAERLLRDGKADFSMRDLAAAAQVSFATPFNHFGSKAAIMHALSARRIDRMMSHLAETAPAGDARKRVLRAMDIAVRIMLEEPAVNRSVMSWLGTTGSTPGQVLAHSTAFWAMALADAEGLVANGNAAALRALPEQLAFAFRGVLSFWTSGELPDDALPDRARDIAHGLLLGFATPV